MSTTVFVLSPPGQNHWITGNLHSLLMLDSAAPYSPITFGALVHVHRYLQNLSFNGRGYETTKVQLQSMVVTEICRLSHSLHGQSILGETHCPRLRGRGAVWD